MPMFASGHRLGPYVVGDLLGTGAFAEVYAARHEALDRDVAIKVLNPRFNNDPTFALRFLREARVSARLTHQNIIRVYDFDQTGKVAYLVMELAPGGTLSDRIREFATLGEAIEALGPVFDSVEFAHTHGVVHRDIKPDNVLISARLDPLLSDFGIARIRSETFDAEDDGVIVGTPYYMAPEQVEGKDVDARTDIYALGILVFRLLAGRFPFRGSNVDSVLYQQLMVALPRLDEAVPSLPAAVDAAVRRATAKDRTERFASAAAFYAALRDAALPAWELRIGDAAAGPPAQPAGAGAVPAAEAPVSASEDLERTITSPSPDLEATVTSAPFDPEATITAGTAPQVDAGSAPPARLPAPARRSSAFTRAQWLTLGVAAVVVVTINVIGFWLNQAGRNADGGIDAPAAIAYVYDNLPWFKSAMTLAALMLAALASYDMWLAVIDERPRTPALYRRLRQYHRLMGYAAALTAFAIGFLTCIGIFGFDFSTTRRAVHTVIGTALLLVIAFKILVVRGLPQYRRHLNVIGLTVLGLYALTFLTSAVPWVWDRLVHGVSEYP